MGLTIKQGDVLTYVGGETHENASKCLTVGAEYEVIEVITGINAIAQVGELEFAVVKDDSEFGHWAIVERNESYFEVVK